MEVKKFLRNYSKHLAEKLRKKQTALSLQLENAKEILSINPRSMSGAAKYIAVSSQLSALNQNAEVERIERRSHRWLLQGDRCARNFFKPFKTKKVSLIPYSPLKSQRGTNN